MPSACRGRLSPARRTPTGGIGPALARSVAADPEARRTRLEGWLFRAGLTLGAREFPIQLLQFHHQLMGEMLDFDSMTLQQPLTHPVSPRVRVRHAYHHSLHSSLDKP